MGVLKACSPRPEVKASELADAMFAASLGAVVSGTAERVYSDPRTFFDNTHPAAQLKKIVEVVFDRLNNPNESGAVIRLSTGFGGGKTHALVSLYHIAKNVTDFSLGTELAPAAKRPSTVSVAAIDVEVAGSPSRNDGGKGMKREVVLELAATFEGHAQRTETGVEYWLARDLQHLLGYSKWDNFLNVVSKAKTACEVAGHRIEDHFADVGKMVDIGAGAQRERRWRFD
jgi:hypothetical protein